MHTRSIEGPQGGLLLGVEAQAILSPLPLVLGLCLGQRAELPVLGADGQRSAFFSSYG
jgi:hypothetical protein